MDMTMVISRNLGWVVRPTEVMAQVPSPPTIIRSTMDTREESISSTLAGSAIRRMSL